MISDIKELMAFRELAPADNLNFFELLYRLHESGESDLYEMRDAAWGIRKQKREDLNALAPYDFIEGAIRLRQRMKE